MGLSKTLQSPEILEEIVGKNFDEVKRILLSVGNKYYEEHSDENEAICENLAAFGLPDNEEIVKKVQESIIIHYAEKVFPLTGTPFMLAEFIAERIDFADARKTLENALQNGAALLATPHFGGVEFITPTISFMKLPINPVLKFTTQNLSDKIRAFAKKMEESGKFGNINFIELGKPNSQGALAMADVLNKNEILFSVFDEETPYSKPVKLLGKNVLGGAGLDKLLKFAGKSVSVFTVFMLRLGENYEMKLLPIDLHSDNPIQQMYSNLESILRDDFVPWYFLHEKIPFLCIS